MSSNLDRFPPAEKVLIRAKEGAQKRIKELEKKYLPTAEWEAILQERVAALLAYRVEHGLLTPDGKRIPIIDEIKAKAKAKAKADSAPPDGKKKRSRMGNLANQVRIVPIDLSLYETDEEMEFAARHCAAVRLALDKKRAVDAITARREENKRRIAAIEAAAPKKTLYAEWD